MLCGGEVLTNREEEDLITQQATQRMDGQRAALIDAVIKHVARARVTQNNVLPLAGQHLVMRTCRVMRRAAMGMLAPQPLAVAGKALIEPNILPLTQTYGVAEPLVGKLMSDEPLEDVVTLDVVGTEDGQALGLQRDFQLIIGDDHLVIGEGILTKETGKEVQHLLLLSKLIQHQLLEAGWRPGTHVAAQGDFHVFAYLHCGEVGRHWVRDAVVPACHGTTRTAAGDQRAVGDHDERIIRGDVDIEGGLLTRGVITREPARCAVRLACDE